LAATESSSPEVGCHRVVLSYKIADIDFPFPVFDRYTGASQRGGVHRRGRGRTRTATTSTTTTSTRFVIIRETFDRNVKEHVDIYYGCFLSMRRMSDSSMTVGGVCENILG
jgi:hypothetical protein